MVELLPGLVVSRETYGKLECYFELLKAWNQRINLVSASALDQGWRRHILDSAQLAFHIPDKQAPILDLGTGAGLPGLVLSILGYSSVSLIESDNRKCIFLREVIRQTDAEAIIVNEHVKTLPAHDSTIVSRAFASINDIFALIDPRLLGHETLILHKGRTYHSELTEAQKVYSFECIVSSSMVDDEGVILRITNICRT